MNRRSHEAGHVTQRGWPPSSRRVHRAGPPQPRQRVLGPPMPGTLPPWERAGLLAGQSHRGEWAVRTLGLPVCTAAASADHEPRGRGGACVLATRAGERVLGAHRAAPPCHPALCTGARPHVVLAQGLRWKALTRRPRELSTH